jgi:hypothetical protein
MPWWNISSNPDVLVAFESAVFPLCLNPIIHLVFSKPLSPHFAPFSGQSFANWVDESQGLFLGWLLCSIYTHSFDNSSSFMVLNSIYYTIICCWFLKVLFLADTSSQNSRLMSTCFSEYLLDLSLFLLLILFFFWPGSFYSFLHLGKYNFILSVWVQAQTYKVIHHFSLILHPILQLILPSLSSKYSEDDSFSLFPLLHSNPRQNLQEETLRLIPRNPGSPSFCSWSALVYFQQGSQNNPVLMQVTSCHSFTQNPPGVFQRRVHVSCSDT